MPNSIQEQLLSVLIYDSALTALVADRIYPGQLPDNETPTPWLFYSVPESVPFDDLGDGPTDVRSEIEFHALADTYRQAKAIIDAVKALLKVYQGGVVSRSLWAGTSEETTEDGYHHVIRFSVWWKLA